MHDAHESTEVPKRVGKQEAPGNDVIDVRCCSIVDRAFAIEALRTIGGPKKFYVLRERPALGAVAFDLLDDQ